MPDLPHEPFTFNDLARLGMTRQHVRDAERVGLIRRVFTGVYVRADAPDDTLMRALAARKVMSPHSVLCDRTAAWIHGVSAYRYAELEATPPLESYVLRGHSNTRRQDCHGRTRDLLPEDWQEVAGVRVTTPLRTAADLACKLPPRRALAALDELARIHGLTASDLTRLLQARYRRRRGVVQARQLAPLIDGRAESPPESWARLELVLRGLPAPTPQHWVVIGGVPTYRLDLAYPFARVAIEYDGEDHHCTPDARAHDARRRALLAELGWHVVVLTKESMREPALSEWLNEVAAVLRARGVNIRG